MRPEDRAAIRRALHDNPARAHADLAGLFGIETCLVTDIAVEALPTSERYAYRRQVRRQVAAAADREHLLRSAGAADAQFVDTIAAVASELLALAARQRPGAVA